MKITYTIAITMIAALIITTSGCEKENEIGDIHQGRKSSLQSRSGELEGDSELVDAYEVHNMREAAHSLIPEISQSDLERLIDTTHRYDSHLYFFIGSGFNSLGFFACRLYH